MKASEICEHFSKHKIRVKSLCLNTLLTSRTLLIFKLYRDGFCPLFSFENIPHLLTASAAGHERKHEAGGLGDRSIAHVVVSFLWVGEHGGSLWPCTDITSVIWSYGELQ